MIAVIATLAVADCGAGGDETTINATTTGPRG
jgi:hypothetical protein